MILPELVKAVQRIDDKLNVLVNTLGPLSTDLQYVKHSARFENELIRSLVSKSVRYPVETFLEESKVKNLDGQTALAFKKNIHDPVTLEMREARKALADFNANRPNIINIQGKLNNEVGNILGRVNQEISHQLDKKLGAINILLSKALRAGDIADKKADEVRIYLESQKEGAKKIVEDRVDELFSGVADRKVASIKGELGGIKSDVNGLKACLSDIATLRSTINSDMDDVKKQADTMKTIVCDAVADAKRHMEVMNAEVMKRLEKSLESSTADVAKVVEDIIKENQQILAKAKSRVDESLNTTQVDLTGKMESLMVKKKELDSLASRTESAIIEIEKTTASVGNSTPRNLRHKIRISNV